MLRSPRSLYKLCLTSMTRESLPDATCCTGTESNVTEKRHGDRRSAELWPPQRSPVSNRVAGKSARRIQGVLACLLCLFRCCDTIKTTCTVIKCGYAVGSHYHNNDAGDFGELNARGYAEPCYAAEIAAGHHRAVPCPYLGCEIGRNDRSGKSVLYFN